MNNATNTNVSPSSATSRATISSNFGVYQQTSIGSSDISIHTLVPDAISAEPYCQALIAKLFFYQIMTLSDTSSVSFSDLMSTVSSYFGLNTGSAKREAEFTIISIHNAFFLVSNPQGVGFWDVSVKSLTIPDLARHPADLTYFTFLSVVPLPRSLSPHQHYLHSLIFFFGCLNHLTLPPLISLYSPRQQYLLH